ncbi:M17 family metallopeptidase [Mycoplasmopsis felifaucium]|uniref:M17 family metallopeptidase n=1 Tax=Mycoplasmopsis felifaucium TaxID=35768 RepID=UPI000486085B|nr:M17 family metallopeptidase [Mycoplasmopsis felifaucium]
MSNLYSTKRDEKILLKAQFKGLNVNEDYEILAKKNGQITELLDKKLAYIYLDEKFEDYDDLVSIIDTKILTKGRDYQIDLSTFVDDKLKIEDVLKAFYSRVIFESAELFNIKKEVPKKNIYSFLMPDDSLLELAKKYEIIALNRNKCRNLQVMPENYCNSEQLAEFIKNDFKTVENVSVKILKKKDIKKFGMNLILAVNRGSTHEPRVVVIEYKGDPWNGKKTVIIGKGITFDTGGVNTKGYHMEGMKYDMSGSVIAAYALKSVAELKLKKNVAVVMCITDNRLDGDAALPENVYKSMSGISVEITDTDAEGRLVMADGLTYGAKVLNATTLVDVATLTGAVLRALGSTYSGIWSTNDQNWDIFNKAAQKAHEKVWRMPLHDDFHEPNTESIMADLQNYNNSEKSDCNTAAMFLKQFTEEVPYIHCDVAGTADLKGKPQGVLIDTLVEFISLK